MNTTSAESAQEIMPVNYRLEQNYPNPFNPSTTIEYMIPQSSNVNISIYTLSGRKIETLIDMNHAPGRYSVNWDGSEHASGVYLCQIKSDAFVQSKKMLLIR